MAQLHFSEQEYTWIVSTFQIYYTTAPLITGYIMDVTGLKLGFFIIFALVRSLINIVHIFAGVLQFLAQDGRQSVRYYCRICMVRYQWRD